MFKEVTIDFPIKKPRSNRRVFYSWDRLDKQASREAKAIKTLLAYSLRTPKSGESGLRNGRGDAAKIVKRGINKKSKKGHL